MSYTVIYKFREDGTAVNHAWISNAWRGAMAVWQALEQRYLPPYIPEYVQRKWWYRPDMSQKELAKRLHMLPSRVSLSTGEEIQKIWDLADDPRVRLDERIVLCTTLDGILVKRENVPRVIKAFRAFGSNTSLPKQADILEKLMESEDWIAVGWNQNSVSSEDWGNCGGPGDRTGTPSAYNCLTMDRHEWLFETITP